MSWTPGLIPRPSAAVLGDVQHKARQFEAAGLEEEEALYRAKSIIANDLSGSVDRRWLRLLPRRGEEPEPPAIAAELHLDPDVERPIKGGPDDVVHGTVDRVERDGLIVTLVDIKTGSIYRDGAVKEEYQAQLRLYAAIWPSHEDGNVESLVIEADGLGTRVQVSVPSPAEGALLVDEAVEALNLARAAAASPASKGQPSPEACRWCSFRPGCLVYIDRMRDRLVAPPVAGASAYDSGWPIDVMGTISDVVQFDLAGTDPSFAVTLENPGGVVRMRGLHAEMLQQGDEPASLEAIRAELVGKQAGAFELRQDMNGADCWTSSPQTILYTYATD